MTESETETPPPAAPFLRVVRGNPTDAEVAALSAVITVAAAAATEPSRPKPAGGWADPGRAARRTHPHGHGGWRGSAGPR